MALTYFAARSAWVAYPSSQVTIGPLVNISYYCLIEHVRMYISLVCVMFNVSTLNYHLCDTNMTFKYMDFENQHIIFKAKMTW